MCAFGTLRIYLNFGCKPKYNFGDSQNITLTKSKYNLHCKLNCEAMIAKREKTVGKRRFFCYRIVFGLSKLHKFRLAVHVSGETFKADFFHCRRDFVVIISDAVCAVCVAAERNFPSAEFVVSFQDVDVGD